MKPGVTPGLPDYFNTFALKEVEANANAAHRRKLSKFSWG